MGKFIPKLKELLESDSYKLSSVVTLIDLCVGVHITLKSEERVSQDLLSLPLYLECIKSYKIFRKGITKYENVLHKYSLEHLVYLLFTNTAYANYCT